VDGQLVREWVPDELWALAEPLIPPQRARPQGGGTAMADPQTVLAAIVYVLRTGCAWRHVPPGFGVSKATAHRRFIAWTRAGAVAAAAPGGPRRARGAGEGGLVPGAARHRQRPGEKGGGLTGAHPVDRGNPGAKLHVLADRTGLPLAVGVSAANTHDGLGLQPLVRAIPAVRSGRGPRRRRPDRLHADTGYDHPHLRAWLRDRRITPRLARRGVATAARLGRHRWQVQSTIAHLVGYRRLATRDERHPELFCAFLTLGAVLTCHHRLTA
jgi:transposase